MKLTEFVKHWNDKGILSIQSWTENREYLKTFNDNLHKAFISTYGVHTPRKYVGASMIGHPVILSALHKIGYRPVQHYMTLKNKYHIYTGHIWEASIVALMQLYGVNVHSMQKEVNFYGILGHIDLMVNHSVFDIKVTNNRFITQFRDYVSGIENGYDDSSRGYISQMVVYKKALKAKHAGWLMLDRYDGTLHLVMLGNQELERLYYENVIQKIKILRRIKTVEDVVKYCPIPPLNGKKLPSAMQYEDDEIIDCLYGSRPLKVLPKSIVLKKLSRLPGVKL